MIYIESQTTCFFDVDDTLIMYDNKEPFDTYIADPYETGNEILVRIHQRHVKLLKDFKAKGYFIVVWSAGGAPWAKQVVNTLCLNDYVDIVMSKPLKYVDDRTAEHILGTRIYINEKGNLEE